MFVIELYVCVIEGAYFLFRYISFYSSGVSVWTSVCVCYHLIYRVLLLLSIAVVIGHSWVELCGRGITYCLLLVLPDNMHRKQLPH